jgi:hypothetical protein
MSERRLVSPSEIEERPLRWLWPDRIPLGAITTLDGDPCGGKSSITYDIAARVTTGRPLPGCDAATIPAAGVVLLQAEDNLGEIVVPRLRALGADMDRIKLFDRKLFAEQPLVLPDDLPLIETAVGDIHARLVVIDPLTAFLGGNSNSDMSVRRAFGPMAAFAEHCDVAVNVVRHLRKTGARNPLYGGMGSIGIIAAARAGLLVGPDPASEDKFRHVLAQSKGSLSDPASLSYRTVKRDDGVIVVEWLGPTKYSAADLAAANAAAAEHSMLLEAQYVLYSILAEGQVPANDVIRLAKTAGVSERTLKRAKRDLGVSSWKRGSGPGSRWFWELPQDDKLLRRFKDKDLDCLLNELIYGGSAPTPPKGKTKCDDDTHRDDDHPGDEDGEWSVS